MVVMSNMFILDDVKVKDVIKFDKGLQSENEIWICSDNDDVLLNQKYKGKDLIDNQFIADITENDFGSIKDFIWYYSDCNKMQLIKILKEYYMEKIFNFY